MSGILDYIQAAKEAQQAKEAGAPSIGVRRRMTKVTHDKNGNVVKKEEGEWEDVKLQRVPIKKGLAGPKMEKTVERHPIPSSTRINNDDPTKEWMSVGEMLSK